MSKFRNCVFALLILLFVIGNVRGQQDKVALDDLGAPSSPAFTILGVQPNEINRPKSFKALETALLSGFSTDNSFQIPSNYSLEVTPFWLKSRPDLSVNELMNPGLKSFWRSLSASIATARRRDLIDSARTVQQIGFGLRATLFPGYLTSAFNDDKASLEAKLAGLGFVKLAIKAGISQCTTNCFADETALRNFLAGRFTGLPSTLSAAERTNIKQVKRNVIDKVLLELQPSSAEECLLVLEEMNERLNQYEETFGVREAAKKVERHYFLRQGFRMDVAAASSVDFPTNDFNYSILSNWGVWLNPSGSWVVGKDVNLELLGVGRYLNNSILTNETRNIDIGGRFIASWRSVSGSVEYIRRFQEVILLRTSIQGGGSQKQTEDHTDHRLVFNVEWHLSERFVLTYALGRNFNLNTSVNGNLISILGLNFGIGPLINVPKPVIK